jgi:hypothetical protein
MQEVVDYNLAIEALKKEVETLEAEKTRLAGEVGGLCITHAKLEELQKKVDLLNKEVEGMKVAEELAMEHALKVIEMADNLRKEVDAERESSAALKAQVDMLTKRLEDAKAIGLAVAELYVGALEHFGGSTSSLPSEPSAFNIFSWMKANFVKLPDFVGGTVDFGALASATNLSKMLKHDGCPHVEGVEEKDLEGPAELRVTSRCVRRSVCHFTKSFWVKFGRVEARSMAEARRAEVGFSHLIVFHLGFLSFVCCVHSFVLFYRSYKRRRLCEVLLGRSLPGLQRHRLQRLLPLPLRS